MAPKERAELCKSSEAKAGSYQFCRLLIDKASPKASPDAGGADTDSRHGSLSWRVTLQWAGSGGCGGWSIRAILPAVYYTL